MSASAGSESGAPGPAAPEASQLPLLEVATPAWRLDHRTREIGRRGVASAREALRRVSASEDEGRRPPQAA
jgi:hypothetical protein